jgi:hypothetical protein
MMIIQIILLVLWYNLSVLSIAVFVPRHMSHTQNVSGQKNKLYCKVDKSTVLFRRSGTDCAFKSSLYFFYLYYRYQVVLELAQVLLVYKWRQIFSVQKCHNCQEITFGVIRDLSNYYYQTVLRNTIYGPISWLLVLRFGDV